MFYIYNFNDEMSQGRIRGGSFGFTRDPDLFCSICVVYYAMYTF